MPMSSSISVRYATVYLPEIYKIRRPLQSGIKMRQSLPPTLAFLLRGYAVPVEVDLKGLHPAAGLFHTLR